MRSKIFLLSAAVFAATLASSHAGGAVGVRWGGGGGGAVGVRWGGGGGGAVGVRWGGGRYCYGGPRWYGWGWRGPAVRVVAPAPVIVPSRTVVVTPGTGGSIVVAAQQRLASMGFYAGPIDGAFGPMTSSAVATYQEDQGLPVTGRLDRRTRASLGI